MLYKILNMGTDSPVEILQTQIRLLLMEQSDLDLYCLHVLKL